MELISSLKEAQKLPNKTKNSTFTSEEIDLKSNNIKRKSFSNISFLTTKYDDVQEKVHFSEKKNLKSNQEDSILDALKNRGLLDFSTEKKLKEYNEFLNRKENSSVQKNNFSYKISLLQEYRIIQKNSAICDTQFENLEYMSQMKNRKIEILENAKKAVKLKMKGNCASRKNDNFTLKNNDDSYNNKIEAEDSKLIYNDNYESYLINSIKNVKLGNNECPTVIAEYNLDKLQTEKTRNEIQELMTKMNKEKEDLKEKLSKRNEEFLNLQKATLKKAKEEELSDKIFIINNLTLEKNALKKKLDKKESKGFLKSIKANVDLEEETYRQRKTALLEKMNYLKFIIKNTNHEVLTSNNSLLANKSINKNPENFFFTTNSNNDCDDIFNSNLLNNKINKKPNCKIIDFNNFTNDVNRFQMDQMSYRAKKKDTNVIFEIGLSQIHSNVFNNENFTVNNINKSIAEVNNRSNFIKNLNEYSVDSKEVNFIREIHPRFLNSAKK